MPVTRLFDAADLAGPLDQDVTDERAAAVERVVWGWLRPALGLAERPDVVSDELFSWAVELGCIYHENPDGKAYYQLGQERSGYSAERRTQILAEVAAASPAATRHSGPQGCFPEPSPWPDPARG